MEQNAYQVEEEIDLKELIAVFMTKWKTIVKVTLIAAVAVLIVSLVYSFIKAPIPYYQASANVNVVATEGKDTQKQAFIEMTKSQTVMENTIAKLELTETPQELLSRLTVAKQEANGLVSITVLHPDPNMAKKIANTIRLEAITFSTNAMDMAAAVGSGSVSLADNPILEKSPVNIILNTIIGGILGLMGIVFIIFLQHSLNDRIQTSDDIEKYLGIRVLSVIPFAENEEINKDFSTVRSNE